MDMTRKILSVAFLGLLAGIFALPSLACADDPAETRPPIIVQQGNTRYVFTSQDEKFRSMLLNAKNLRIHSRNKTDPQDYYRNYYSHHRYIRDHEKDERRRGRNHAAYDSGYIAGRLLTDD